MQAARTADCGAALPRRRPRPDAGAAAEASHPAGGRTLALRPRRVRHAAAPGLGRPGKTPTRTGCASSSATSAASSATAASLAYIFNQRGVGYLMATPPDLMRTRLGRSLSAPLRLLTRRSAGQGSLDLPRPRVISTMAPCHMPSHIPPAGPPHRPASCLRDRIAQFGQERAASNCAARSAGSGPHQNLRFAARWAFLRHTHRVGSLPANCSLREGCRRRSFCVRGGAGRAAGYRAGA